MKAERYFTTHQRNIRDSYDGTIIATVDPGGVLEHESGAKITTAIAGFLNSSVVANDPHEEAEARTEPTNQTRAEFARTAVDAFMKETGSELSDAIADLICDLCHLAKQEGMDPLAEVQRGLQHYVCEAIDPPDGMSHEAQAHIDILARKYGDGGAWEQWEPSELEAA
jgi:hypothetical protein